MFNKEKRHKQVVTAVNQLIIKKVTADTSWDDIVSKMAEDATLEKSFVVELLTGEHRDQFKDHADSFADSLGVNAKDAFRVSREDKKKYYTYVPWGVTSFAELDAVVEAQEEAAKIYDIADQYVSLFWNIVDSSEIEDKRAALTALNAEFQQRLEDPPNTSDKDAGDDPSPTSGAANAALPQAAKSNSASMMVAPPLVVAPPPFMVWKDADGVWKWLGIYSNAFEDRHQEILSTVAHQEFEKAFDSGEWPVVELWPWHLPVPVGYSTMVSFDPVTKMAICAGEFVEGAEGIAEAWSKRKDLGMSHGMPYSELQYNPNEKDVIDRYRSQEFTVLPLTEAANLLTDFSTYKEFTMPIPADKKQFLLESGMTEPQITVLESKMQVKAAAGDVLGLRFKELLSDDPPASQSPPAPATPTTPAVPPQVPPPAADSVDKSVAAASGEYSLDDLVVAMKDIGQRQQADIAALQKELGDLRAQVSTSLLAMSPQQSLTEVLSKDIFGEDSPARLDGRTSLAKDGPLENKDAAAQQAQTSMLSSAIDYMMEMTTTG